MANQGRTQVWIARQLGRTPETIGRYLSGERPCPKDTSIAWAVKLGLPLDVFWDEAADVESTRIKTA